MQSSEIILNPDRSIYHLHLKNGELAPKVITVGDPDRIDWVLPHFDHLYFHKRHREFAAATGRIGEEELSVVSTGIGTDNIDIVLNELHLVRHWDFEKAQPLPASPSLQILRLGTSGALQPDIPVDSFLRSEQALGFDGLLYFYEHDFPYLDLGFPALPQPYLVSADPTLNQRYAESALFPGGLTLTANGFYGPQGRSATIAPRYPQFLDQLAQRSVGQRAITNLEMETAGIYGLGALLGMQCLSLSVILANRSTGVFSAQAEKSTRHLISEALRIFLAS